MHGKATAMDIRQFAYAGIDVYGILAEYMGTTTEQIKDMDISFEDLSNALILAGSEGGKYFGAMDSMSGTLTGKVSKLKVQVEEMLMSLTESLLPTIQKIVDKISALVDRFNQLDPQQKELITKVLLVTASLGPIVTILGKVITAVGTIAGWLSKLSSLIGEVSASLTASGTSLSSIAGPIGLIIGLITGLTAEFVHLFKTNEEFNAKVNETWSSLVDFFQNSIMPIWNELVELVKSVCNTIWEIIQEIWSQIEPYIQEAFEIIMDWWNDTGKEIFSVLAKILEKLLWAVRWLWENVVDPILKYYFENLKPAIEFLANFVSSTIKFLLQTISDWWDMVKGIFNGIITFLTGVFTGNWQQAWQGIKDIFASIVNGLVNVFKTPLNYIIDLINGFIRGVNKIQIPDWVPRNRWYDI